MPRTLSDEILTLLSTRGAGREPVTIAQLSRAFGVSSQLVRSCAKQLVSAGTAVPYMAMNSGVSTIQGLLPVTSDKVSS